MYVVSHPIPLCFSFRPGLMRGVTFDRDFECAPAPSLPAAPPPPSPRAGPCVLPEGHLVGGRHNESVDVVVAPRGPAHKGGGYRIALLARSEETMTQM